MSIVPQWLKDMGFRWAHIPALDRRVYTAGNTPFVTESDDIAGVLTNIQAPYGNREISGVYGTDFDGADDYINMGNAVPVNYSQNKFTLVQWIRFREKSAAAYGFSARSVSSNGIISYYTSDQWYVAIRNGDTGNVRIPAVTPFAIGAIHCLVVVYNGAGATNEDKIKIYVDGFSQTIGYNVGYIAPSSISMPSNAQHVIGNNSLALTAGFTGAIHHTSFFLKNLSQQEVQTLCSKGPTLGLTGTISGPNGESMDLKDKRRAGGGRGYSYGYGFRF
jgi:hypothetical protein